MNQKQRDILCKMVQKRADEIRSRLKNGTKFNVMKDLGDYYRITHHQFTDENVRKLPKTMQSRFARLKKQQQELDAKQKDLTAKVTQLGKDIGEIIDGQKLTISEATAKLDKHVQSAIIQIQFAENAEQAQAILDSLPSVESLL